MLKLVGLSREMSRRSLFNIIIVKHIFSFIGYWVVVHLRALGVLPLCSHFFHDLSPFLCAVLNYYFDFTTLAIWFGCKVTLGAASP